MARLTERETEAIEGARMTRREQHDALHAANAKMVDAGLLMAIIDVDGEPALQCALCGEIDGHTTTCSVLDRVRQLALNGAAA